MEISKIKIKRVIENKGHIGFASCVIDNCLRLNNIAIFARLNGGYRLVFPEKKIKDSVLQIFYPLTQEFYYQLEKEIISKL